MVSWRERVAIHEASHACVCILYNIPIVSISIDGDMPNLFRDLWLAPAGLDSVQCMATLCLAGIEAEKAFCGSFDDGGNSDDVVMARHYLSRRFGPLQIGIELERARTAASNLVRSAWGERCIRRVAAALVAHGTLTGAEVKCCF
jgi:hypothetical protein